MSDNVNHPNHYTVGGIEVIDYIQAKLTPEQFEGYLLGNVIKYVSRHGHKNGYEDLRKAQWCLDRVIQGEEPIPTYNHPLSNRPKTKPGEIEKPDGIGELERRMNDLVKRWTASMESAFFPKEKSITSHTIITPEDILNKKGKLKDA